MSLPEMNQDKEKKQEEQAREKLQNRVYAARKNLGTSLVEAGIITPAQLEEALRYRESQQGKKPYLGQTLIGLGFCTEEDISRVVARQAGVPFVSLEQVQIDQAAASLITYEIARRFGVIPIRMEEGKLVVAMMNPNDIIAIDDLRLLTGYDIIPVKANDSEIESILEKMGRDSKALDVPEEEVETVDVSAPAASEDTIKPAVQLANLIFRQAVRAGASDIHIEPQERGLRVRFRIDGVLHDVMHPPRQLHASLVSRIKVQANLDIAERRIPQDGRITLKVENKTVDFRVATLPSAYGEKVTMRILDRSASLITLDQLGFRPDQLERYRRVMRLPYGFILVTGPTGSGKTTTLYATLSELNDVEKNIITLEDPIEYRMNGITQVQINPRAGLTFANGLRSILRNDPDIIMVGEIRDHETARIAVESALTGHLVLSTLHTNDAAGAVTRLGDMGIEPFLIASSVVGVIGQRLVRVLCPHCKEPYRVSREEVLKAAPDFPFPEDRDYIEIYKPRGCLRCTNTGYKGRMGVYEFLVMDEKIQRLTLARASTSEIKAAAIEGGMQTFRTDGYYKVLEGKTSMSEVFRVTV